MKQLLAAISMVLVASAASANECTIFKPYQDDEGIEQAQRLTVTHTKGYASFYNHVSTGKFWTRRLDGKKQIYTIEQCTRVYNLMTAFAPGTENEATFLYLKLRAQNVIHQSAMRLAIEQARNVSKLNYEYDYTPLRKEDIDPLEG